MQCSATHTGKKERKKYDKMQSSKSSCTKINSFGLLVIWHNLMNCLKKWLWGACLSEKLIGNGYSG